MVGAYAVWTADRRDRLGHVGDPRHQRGLGRLARRLRPPSAPSWSTRRWPGRGCWPGSTTASSTEPSARSPPAAAPSPTGRRRWLEPGTDALPRGVAAAGRGLASGSTRVAERGVDALVAGVAWLVERAGADARRSHTGMVHHQFVVIVVGLGLVAVAAVLGR